MGRKPRIHLDGAFYHVILKGNNGCDIFLDDGDRRKFLDLAADGTTKFDHKIHAFCLMRNHVHLLIRVGAAPLSDIIHNLSSRYARYFNKKSGRTGHLFRSRYRAILIDEDTYLLALVRYISLNPVRAGIADDPEDYPWSSHGAYLGMDEYEWLETDRVLSLFGFSGKRAVNDYAGFVNQGGEEGFYDNEEIDNRKDPRILGGTGFTERILQRAGRGPNRLIDMDKLITAVCLKFGIDREDLPSRTSNRNISAALGVLSFIVKSHRDLTFRELSDILKRDAGGLSKQAKRAGLMLSKDKGMRGQIDDIVRKARSAEN